MSDKSQKNFRYDILSLYSRSSESAMEILGTNINNNKHLYPSIDLEANVLDWEEEELPQNVQDGVDFIMFVSLIGTIFNYMLIIII